MMQWRVSFRGMVAALASFVASPVVAEHPDMPPGEDPGGTAVAIVSTTLNFKQPELQPKLARDGEGLAIAWDFSPSDSETPPLAVRPEGLARYVIQNLTTRSDIRLVPVRIEADDPQSLAQALAFVSHTPAQMLVLDLPMRTPLQEKVLKSAGEKIPELLIVAPPNSQLEVGDPAKAETNARAPLANTSMIVVAPASGSNVQGSRDVLVDVPSETSSPLAAIAQSLSITVRTLVACARPRLETGDDQAPSVRLRALATLAGEERLDRNGLTPVDLKPCPAAYQ